MPHKRLNSLIHTYSVNEDKVNKPGETGQRMLAQLRAEKKMPLSGWEAGGNHAGSRAAQALRPEAPKVVSFRATFQHVSRPQCPA